MKARMKNPAVLIPEAMQALYALNASTEKHGLPFKTIGLCQLRASQINGCSVCVDMHSKMLKKDGETDERLFGVSAWREMPYFSEPERAALTLTEEVTRLSERPDGISDETWQAAVKHYDEPALASLLISISAINVWNRLNAATRQIAGEWKS